MPKAFLTVVDTIYVLWRPGGKLMASIRIGHMNVSLCCTPFSRAASAFTLVDQYRSKHRLCTSAIPDPSLDAGHAKRGRPSVEKHLRCHVGVSGETERRQFLQDRQRQQGMYNKGPRAFDPQFRNCTSETEVLLRRESVGPSGEHAELLGPCFFFVGIRLRFAC